MYSMKRNDIDEEVIDMDENREDTEPIETTEEFIDTDEEGNEKMLEDKLFCVVYGINPQGELIVDDEGHHNEWLTDEELASKGTVFQSVPEITAMGQEAGIGYIEHKYYYKTEEY